mgnify:CR=1 FL=1
MDKKDNHTNSAEERNTFGSKTFFKEKITYSIREGVELTEEEYNFINEVLPLGTLKGAYTSTNFDTIFP